MNETDLLIRAKNGNQDAAEKIVEDNQGLVWSVARRFVGRGYDLEEIYQIGCIGLLKAIKRFDVSYNAKFSTYAVPLITGEIKRFLRDNGMIKVSRILKQNGYRISQIREEYTNAYGKEPSIEELSEKSGLSIEEIIEAFEANKEVESLYQTTYGKDGKEVMLLERVCEEGAGEKEQERLFNKIIIEGALSKLNKNERSLIYLRYYKNKTQTEVAKQLNMTQVQISRLEKKLLTRIKSELDTKTNY